jgi:prepilin-type processing-associated H-X9-DG protein
MMRELLLAYLFGQLGLREREQVERALAERPRLREELRRLQECLLAEGQEHEGDEKTDLVEPPADLVKRTCDRIAELVRCEEAGGYTNSPGDAEGRRPSEGMSAPWARFSDRNCCSVAELTGAICVTVVMATLIVPAIHDSRVYARRDQCQDQLRQIILGINSFASSNAGAIPWVPDVGKDAFAGIFPVLLADGHYVDRQQLGQLLVCPATIRAGEWRQEGYLLRLFIPTHEQVMAASERSLAALRKRLAGSYAYRFGYVNDYGRYCEWRLDNSPHSAILSDAPGLSRLGFQSSNHGGCGQNVAYADGHVEFIIRPACGAGRDHLFLNDAGVRAAAIGENDSVLGRSDANPAVELVWRRDR